MLNLALDSTQGKDQLAIWKRVLLDHHKSTWEPHKAPEPYFWGSTTVAQGTSEVVLMWFAATC